jgi:hypothetical protein
MHWTETLAHTIGARYSLFIHSGILEEAMPFGSVNYLAVIVGTVFNMVLGALWYGPILGKQWLGVMEKMGKSREDMESSPSMYAFTLVLAFIGNLTLALVIKASGVDAWWMGLLWGAVLWIGTGASAQLTSGFFEDRPIALWLIFGSYYLIVYSVMGIVYVIWP